MGFLTDLKIRTAASRAKEYVIADGDGFYLRVRATSKTWLYRYKSDEKQTGSMESASSAPIPIGTM